MKRILVGIVGRKGRGKSTLAEIMAGHIEGARVVGLADALKRDVHAMVMGFGHLELLPEDLEPLKGDCLGPMYQGYGELMRRLRGEDYWITRLESVLPERAIVADVRHVNEAEWIKARSGVLIGVIGSSWREGDTRSDEHPSERYVDDCIDIAHALAFNTRGLDHLRSTAQNIARRIMEGLLP